MKVLKGSIRRWGLTIDRISRGGINGGITPVSSLSKHSVGPPTLNTPPKTIHSSGMVELRIDGKMRKKECFFTKRNIGPNGVYYQAVTEWGFTIYALPSSMELIGCPTICDEDLRQIQSKAPHRYKYLSAELRLSSSWNRVSKFCSFSSLPIPDGTPFYIAKRSSPLGNSSREGYFYLHADLVSASEIEHLSRNNLKTLLSHYPDQCDVMDPDLLQDPNRWAPITKFCYFSGAPITADDMYYTAKTNGKNIFMLVVFYQTLSPRQLFKLDRRSNSKASPSTPLTPEEIKLAEQSFDLSDEDFELLRQKHLGKYNLLPSNLSVSSNEWELVAPAEFLAAKQEALKIHRKYEEGLPIAWVAANAYEGITSKVTDMVKQAHLSLASMSCGSPVADLRQCINNAEQHRIENDKLDVDVENLEEAADVIQTFANRIEVSVDELLRDVTPSSKISKHSYSAFDENSVLDLTNDSESQGTLYPPTSDELLRDDSRLSMYSYSTCDDEHSTADLTNDSESQYTINLADKLLRDDSRSSMYSYSTCDDEHSTADQIYCKISLY